MIYQLIDLFGYACVLAGLFFLLVGNLKGNFIMLLFAIPFENTINILPSVSLIKALSIITFFSFIVHGRNFVPFIFKNLVINKFILSFVAIFFSAALVGENHGNFLNEMTGFIQNIMILSICWYAVKRMPGSMPWIEKAFIFYGLAILILIFSVHDISVFKERLFLSRFLGPNTIAVLYSGLAVLAYTYWRLSGSKFYLLAFAAFGVAIILSGNRSLPFGFVFFILLSFFLNLKVNKIRLFVLAGSLAVIFFVFPFDDDSFINNSRSRVLYGFEQFYDLIIQGSEEMSTEERSQKTNILRTSNIQKDIRTDLYRKTVESAMENPILGTGPGTSNITIERYFGISKNPHSNFNLLLLDYGLTGFIFFMIVEFVFIRFGYKNISSVEGKQFFVLLVMFSIDGLVHTNLKDSIVILFLAITGFKVGINISYVKSRLLKQKGARLSHPGRQMAKKVI